MLSILLRFLVAISIEHLLDFVRDILLHHIASDCLGVFTFRRLNHFGYYFNLTSFLALIEDRYPFELEKLGYLQFVFSDALVFDYIRVEASDIYEVFKGFYLEFKLLVPHWVLPRVILHGGLLLLLPPIILDDAVGVHLAKGLHISDELAPDYF